MGGLIWRNKMAKSKETSRVFREQLMIRLKVLETDMIKKFGRAEEYRAKTGNESLGLMGMTYMRLVAFESIGKEIFGRTWYN
jgi:hypothetical protein